MTSAVAALAARVLRTTFRRPQFLAPLVVFPSLFLAVNVGGLHRSTALPGFPHVHGFLDFQLAGAITQSLLLGGVSAGLTTALDIEGGFFDRLAASPVPRSAIVLGRLTATAVLACLQVAWFVVLGLVFGAHVAAGVPGVLVVALIAAIAAIGFGGIGVLLALSARSASTVQGIFPLVFVVLFVSSAFFPQSLLSSPADAIAAVNPLSLVANGMREPIISGLSARPVLEGLAAATGMAALFAGLSVAVLRVRLGRA